jgi:hypothetical protein
MFVSPKKSILFHSVNFEYPEYYTCIHEGGETVGFAKYPGTIGVLRITPYCCENELHAKEIYTRACNINTEIGMELEINECKAWFYIEQKKHGSNDYLFWPEGCGPMSMYFYTMRIEKNILFISYRIPEYMEDNGLFDEEHVSKMEIIASATR